MPIQRGGFDTHTKKWFWCTYKRVVLMPTQRSGFDTIQRSGFDGHTKRWFWWSYKEVVMIPIQRSGFNAHTKKWFGHPYKEVILMPILSGFDAHTKEWFWCPGPATVIWGSSIYNTLPLLLLQTAFVQCSSPLSSRLAALHIKKIIMCLCMLGYFSASIIHQTVTWTTGSLMCMWSFCFCIHRGILFVFARTSLWSCCLYSTHPGGLSLKSYLQNTFVESADTSTVKSPRCEISFRFTKLYV